MIDFLLGLLAFLLLVGLCIAAYYIGKYSTSSLPPRIQYTFLPKEFSELHSETFNTDPNESLSDTSGARRSSAVAAFEQYQ